VLLDRYLNIKNLFELMIKYRRIILPIFIITILFTLSDYLVHFFIDFFKIIYYPDFLHLGLSPLSLYSIFKFIGTIFLLFVGIFIISKFKIKNIYFKYIILLLIVVLPLQIRYSYSGYYTSSWLWGIFGVHSALLLFSIFTADKIFGNFIWKIYQKKS